MKYMILTASIVALQLCCIGVAQAEKTADNIDAESRKMMYFFGEAVRVKEQGKLDAAMDLLTECYYINKNEAAVWAEMADVYKRMGNIDKAIVMEKIAIKLDGSKEIWWKKKELAEMMLKSKRVDDAIEVYEDMSKEKPEVEEIDYRLAGLYLQRGKLDNCLEALKRLEKKIGTNEEVTLEIYHILQLKGEKKKARKEIEKLVSEAPMSVDRKIMMASVLMQDSAWTEAEKVLNEAMELDSTNVRVINLKLQLLRGCRREVEADSLIIKTMGSKDIDVNSKLVTVGKYWSERTKVETAERALAALRETHPNNAEVRAYAAAFYLMQRDGDKAEKELITLVKLDGDNVNGWKELIGLYIQQQDTTKALETCNKALEAIDMKDDRLGIKSSVDKADILMLRGLSLGMAGRDWQTITEAYDDALKELGATGDTIVKDMDRERELKCANLFMLKGDRYAMNNVLDMALKYYEASYRLNPNDPLLLNNFAYYSALNGGDLEKAERMVAKALAADGNNVAYLDTYAWILHLKGDGVMARMFIEQAMSKSGGKDATIMEHYKVIMDN